MAIQNSVLPGLPPLAFESSPAECITYCPPVQDVALVVTARQKPRPAEIAITPVNRFGGWVKARLSPQAMICPLVDTAKLYSHPATMETMFVKMLPLMVTLPPER